LEKSYSCGRLHNNENAMKLSTVLLLYKKSVYQIYFKQKKSSLLNRLSVLPKGKINQFLAAHEHHYMTLRRVEQTLTQYGVFYRKCCRGQKIDYMPYNFVITVGGDGTFLEAARNLKKQCLLGVNSDPQRSMGRFCFADGFSFGQILAKILCGRVKLARLHRLLLKVNSRGSGVPVVNDLLICHENPAAMSRYELTINAHREEQWSSGVWFATAAGSTGAISSAGGKVLPLTSRQIQYLPRELQHRPGNRYRLTGGILSLRAPVQVTSLMRQGAVFVDGAHLKLSLSFGQCAEISYSPEPLNVVVG
jgi:NAD+ kinase